MEERIIISCENLMKIYKTSDIEVAALQGLNLTVRSGEILAIIGSSGSGKSTLLNIIGGLVKPSAGKIIVNDMDISKFTYSEMVKYKRETIGFVWQNKERNLIPYLTALDNIKLVMKIGGYTDYKRAEKLLEDVGLSNKKNSRLEQLSGGEQQQIAIAIGIASYPNIILADEPTGSVDSATASEIMDIFRHLQQEMGLTIIIVTHDNKLAAKVDRVVLIRDGRTSSEYIKKNETQNGSDVHTDFNKDSHHEYIVLDNVGRLQIPQELMKTAELHNHSRVKLQIINGNITIIPIK